MQTKQLCSLIWLDKGKQNHIYGWHYQNNFSPISAKRFFCFRHSTPVSRFSNPKRKRTAEEDALKENIPQDVHDSAGPTQAKLSTPSRSPKKTPGLFVCLFCCFTSQVNSYGHCGTVSSPNHTFSWASLNKQLTSTSCTYFRL